MLGSQYGYFDGSNDAIPKNLLIADSLGLDDGTALDYFDWDIYGVLEE